MEKISWPIGMNTNEQFDDVMDDTILYTFKLKKIGMFLHKQVTYMYIHVLKYGRINIISHLFWIDRR